MSDPDRDRRGDDGGAGRGSFRSAIARHAALALFSVSLAVGGYYGPLWRGESDALPMNSDGAYFVYQFARMGDLNGRWWKLADDPKVGFPYATDCAKHPGLFEGVDLLLLSSITSKFLSPIVNYHVLMILAIALNGWVGGAFVWRHTRSVAWAALGCLLITWNMSTSFRLMGHPHLLKWYWIVPAVAAFSAYLDAPSLRRGLVLGAAVAMVLQANFTVGFLVGSALGLYWLGCLVAGRIGRRHARPTAAALLAFAAIGIALTFPVWTTSMDALAVEIYKTRTRTDVWRFSSELWQYFVQPDTELAASYTGELSGARYRSDYSEGWHYPGRVVLLGIAAYLACRLRGVRLPLADRNFVDRCVALAGILMLLSLAGGPAVLINEYISSFRAYGRAGMATLAIACVAAPVALCALTRRIGPVPARVAATAAVLALGAYDGYHGLRFPWHRDVQIPAWVDWLEEQPPSERMAAFRPIGGDSLNLWGFDGLLYRSLHQHAALNACDFFALEADLRLLGASYEAMTEPGLRFVASLGYNNLAFRRDYLDAHPWIAGLDWLEPAAERDDWTIYRVGPRFEPMPRLSRRDLLARASASPGRAEVPARSWVTFNLDPALDHEVVVPDPGSVELLWVDASGRPAREPVNGLFQHVFSPSIPAVTLKAPKEPGRYELVAVDGDRRSTLKVVDVRGDLPTLARRYAGRSPELAVSGTIAEAPGDGRRLRVAVENPSPYYLPVHYSREEHFPSVRSHPMMAWPDAGALLFEVLLLDESGAPASKPSTVLLARDLPPHGRIEMDVPLPAALDLDAARRVSVSPMFLHYFARHTDPEHAELRLSAVAADGPAEAIATAPPPAGGDTLR